MSVEDSESRRFELNIRLSFSQANLGPTSAQELFFVFFLESLELFFPRFVLIASGTEMLWRVPFESESFLRQYRVPIAIGLLITAPFLFLFGNISQVFRVYVLVHGFKYSHVRTMYCLYSCTLLYPA